jgi:hypothetical protein
LKESNNLEKMEGRESIANGKRTSNGWMRAMSCRIEELRKGRLPWWNASLKEARMEGQEAESNSEDRARYEDGGERLIRERSRACSLWDDLVAREGRFFIHEMETGSSMLEAGFAEIRSRRRIFHLNVWDFEL